MRWAVRLSEIIFGRISMALLVWLIFSYGKIARLRYRYSPEVIADIDEFIVRRTDLDRRAAQHRLHLITANDPRPIARHTTLPVYYLSGGIDPIVPWPFVKRWLRKHCRAWRECKIIGTADHNILGTAPAKAASQILDWMRR
jgi:pimeloyl-ACP methyl ester carboxylesterase